MDVIDVDHQMIQEDEELRRMIETLSELNDMEWVPDSISVSKRQPLLLDRQDEEKMSVIINKESKTVMITYADN